MATQLRPSLHDAVVKTAGMIYHQHGKYAWTNPGSEKNKSWNGYFIDVIAANEPYPASAWVTEVETDSSVNDAQARTQWVAYDEAYQVWYMAVPSGHENEARRLFNKYGIIHCTVFTWWTDRDGQIVFSHMPGLT